MNLATQGLGLINGKEVEWADQSLYIDGVRVRGIKGNKHGVKTDKAHLFAEGDYPFGIQSGNNEPTGSLKVLKSVMDALNAAAVLAGGRHVNDLEFDIVTVYKAAGVRGMQRMTQSGCQTTAFEYGWDQNAKEMVVDLPYLYMDLLFD
jgi:hypothetical protein